LALGLSLDECRERRDDQIEAWCRFLHDEMDRLRASDPSEILPHLAARIEERANPSRGPGAKKSNKIFGTGRRSRLAAIVVLQWLWK
jgi:hypothetical protein